MHRRYTAALTLTALAALLLSLGGCPPNLANLFGLCNQNPNQNNDCNTPCDPNAAQSTLVDVHLFKYDTATKEYVLGTKRVSEAEVKRDLAGALCGKCHDDEVAELKDSVHYRWASRNDNVLFPGGGAHGMIDRACGLPASSALVNYTADVELDECGKCHVGRYLPMMEQAFAGMLGEMGLEDAQEQAAGLMDAGLDCLICHSEEYRSYPEDTSATVSRTAPADGQSPTPIGYARVARDDTDFDGDGTPDALIDTNGDGTPDTPLMMDTDGDGTPDTPFPTIAQEPQFRGGGIDRRDDGRKLPALPRARAHRLQAWHTLPPRPRCALRFGRAGGTRRRRRPALRGLPRSLASQVCPRRSRRRRLDGQRLRGWIGGESVAVHVLSPRQPAHRHATRARPPGGDGVRNLPHSVCLRHDLRRVGPWRAAQLRPQRERSGYKADHVGPASSLTARIRTRTAIGRLIRSARR